MTRAFSPRLSPGTSVRRSSSVASQAAKRAFVGYGDSAIISVDEPKSWERQRFSVGHELGHWHHHRGRCLICRSDNIGNARKSPSDPERVADAYSADLLLPRYIFNAFLNDFKKLNVKVLRDTTATPSTCCSDRHRSRLVQGSAMPTTGSTGPKRAAIKSKINHSSCPTIRLRLY